MSAANSLEAAIVIEGPRSPISSRRLDEAIAEAGIVGDCFAYALAKATREPLLFKGDDFSWTDVAAA